ncbi:UDP-glucose pyrophosphorylase [Chlamydiales bacterium STE3]|nr:UDP-glucose pyrophosphorylase [Chlamydiales bacterium STE3]
MIEASVRNELQQLGQEHLLKVLDSCSGEEKKTLLLELKNLDFSLLAQQRQLLFHPPQPYSPPLPCTHFSYCNEEEKTLGERLLKEGAMGCLIVAGGQGTRAKFTQPKGLFPISNVMHKSLLQLFCEKTYAASHFAKRPLHLAIMTSPLNHDEIHSFLKTNHYFGLEETQVSLFAQQTLPFLDDEGRLFLSSPGHLAKGPNGNGHALIEFVKSGIWKKWRKQNVRYLNFVMIDNPLADPFDLTLLDYHVRKKVNLTLKCISRSSPKEKVGIITKNGVHAKVVEYSEASPSVAQDLKNYPLANISLFLINMTAISKLREQAFPLHLAHKPTLFFDSETREARQILAWKFEFFIFDLLDAIKEVAFLNYPREKCFAPVKNLEDVEKARLALLENDREAFRKLTGLPPPSSLFELDQQFYYPTDELRKKWWGKEAPKTAYLSP